LKEARSCHWVCGNCGRLNVTIAIVVDGALLIGRDRWCQDSGGCCGGMILTVASGSGEDSITFSAAAWSRLTLGEVPDEFSDGDVETVYLHASNARALYPPAAWIALNKQRHRRTEPCEKP
jgi:hypothetical protein